MNFRHAVSKITSKITGKFISVWLLGGALTLVVYLVSEYNHKEQLQQRTTTALTQAVELVKQRFAKYEYGLLITRGAIVVAGSDKISRHNFERYIASLNLAKEFPGALGFGFIRRVFPDEQTDFITRARADGAPNFKVKTLTPHGKDRFIIQYIYPELVNKEAIGLDIGSEGNRRAAAVKAAISAKATLSAPITLVQAEGKPRRGFLIMLPVYNQQLVGDLPEQRLQATVGWSYAPLIVDDVLFDLGPILSEIDLSITDKAEQQPFFTTGQTAPEATPSADNLFTSEIQFMGRKWVVHAYPKLNNGSSIVASSSIWIIFVGLLLTSLSYLIVLFLSVKQADKFSQDIHENSVNPATFFASSTFRKLSKGYLLVILCIIPVSGYVYVEQEIAKSSSLLSRHLRDSERLINLQQQNYSEGLAFIKSSPAVSEMLKTSYIDSTDSLLYSSVKSRLAETFKAYMQSLYDVYQIRLISADLDGKELVRVERNGEAIIVAPEYDLQHKGDRDYFANTLKLSNGDIYVSAIEPNIENGMMEVPIRLTRRFSTPIFYPDGRPYAIIVINVDADSLLKEINQLSGIGEFIFLTNQQSQFILAAHEAQVYGSFTQPNYVWDTVFQRSPNIFEPEANNITTWQGEHGAFISAQARITPNQGELTGQLIINATQTTAEIYKNVLSLLLKQLLILLAISLLALVLFYYSWVNTRRAIISARIKQELEEQQQKDSMFESLTELSPEAMVIIDTSGQIILVNSQAEKLFGYQREQLIGENINILVPVDIASKHDQYVADYMQQPKARPMGGAKELYSLHADGSQFPVEVSLSPIKLDNKMLIASSIRNISERKRIEHSLIEAIDKAKSASQAKTAFLANMSHEIRTPLNAVIGLTHLLKDAGLTAAQLKLVSNIQLAGRSLLSIVNDILDLAKIEANEMSVVQAPCNLKELLGELFSVFSSQAERKNIELFLEIDPNICFWVETDIKLLQQIISNLLSNAIKFTIEGQVTLSAKRIQQTDAQLSQQLVCFTVSDTGIGIDPAIQEKIFDPFNQADDGTNRKFEGTGLGLSIVRNLSHLLDGEIGVSSELGKGSQFWLKVPFVEAIFEQDLVGESIVAALNVWIFTDPSNSESTLTNIARSLGWKVFQATDITQISDQFSQRIKARGPFPDILLINCQAQQLQCLAFLDSIFTLPQWPDIPVVAIVLPEQSQQIKKLDQRHRIKGFLTKPVAASDLFNIVNDSISENTGNNSRVLESTKMEAVNAKWLPNVNILVVDDSQLNLEVVEKILTNNGAMVTTANSGVKAIDCLENNPDQFDVVLMDIQMPIMDGLEATAYIRKRLNYTAIPIIALTAGILEEEKNTALAAGMDAFLSKPIEPSKLILCLRKYVENYRQQGVMIESIELSAQSKEAADWPEINGIDNSIELFQGDRELFAYSLRRLFIEHDDLEDFFSQSVQLQRNEDRLLLAARIHKLRGSAGMIGAKHLYNLASRAEISLRNGEDNKQHGLIVAVLTALNDLIKDSAEFIDKQHKIDTDAAEIDLSSVKPLDPAELTALLNALKNNDLHATEIAEKNKLSLQALLGKRAFSPFINHIRGLEYAQAAQILQQHQNQAHG